MNRLRLLPRGLIGRLVAILLVTLVVEFAVSTTLYERASEFSVRADEARRLAEHLVIARRLVTEAPPPARPAMADELTTDRYLVRWSAEEPRLPDEDEDAGQMRAQIVAWEPTLAETGIRARALAQGGSTVAVGALRLSAGDWLYFRTIAPLKTTSATYERILSTLVPMLVLMLLGGLLILQTLKPIRSLTHAVERFGPGLDQPLPTDGGAGTADVQRLVEAFNEMQARIRRLIDERTRALAAVSHDLRTPLARLRLRVEAVEDPALRREVEDDLDGMEAMVTSLLAFLGGEGEPEKPRLVDLAVLTASIVDDASDHGRDARYDGPAHLEIAVRPSGIRRAIVNLVDNAGRYGTHAVVRLVEEGKGVAIIVEDDGPGIPEEAQAMVLEPFVRLDHARGRDTSGFGLGLSIVARAVKDEGGEFRLTNRPEGGLAATIRLPDPSSVPQ